MKKALLFGAGLFLISISSLFSQNFTTKGKDFWLAYMWNAEEYTVPAPALSLYISSDVTTSGTVNYAGGGGTVNFNVTAGNTTKIVVPLSYEVTSTDMIEDMGIHVLANDSVSVFALNYGDHTADATAIFPTPALGHSYIVTTYYPYLSSEKYTLQSSLMVVATENNTKVEFYFPIGGGGYYSSPNKTVVLNAGQCFQLHSQSISDLTGTKVRSVDNGSGCKKIAVFGGAPLTTIGNCWAADHLYEEMYPIDTWGYNYVTTPYYGKATDLFRVVASQNNTQIKINGGAPVTINTGQFYQFSSGTANYITSNYPVSVTQFCKGNGCDPPPAFSDPFMIVLSPVEQTLNYLTFNAYTSAVITQYYANIVTKTGGTNSIKFDGSFIGSGSFSTVPGNPAYSHVRLTITAGNHTLQSDSGFTVSVYGFGNEESYGYAGGASLKRLDNFTISKPGNICTGTSVTFASSPPNPAISSYYWNFGDGATATTSSISHSYSTPGTYTVSLIIQKGDNCVKDTIKKAITIVGSTLAFTSNEVCNGAPTSFTDQSIGGGTITSWSWDFGDGSPVGTTQNPTHIYTSSGSYTATLTINTSDGCSGSKTQSVTINSLPVVGFTGQSNVDCFGNSTGSVAASVSSGTPAYQYSWSNNSTLQTMSGVGNGTYTLVVTDSKGCLGSGQVIITQPTAPLAISSATATPANCYGSATGSSTVSASGGTTNYSYSWSSGATTTTASNLTAATYTIKVTDANGCSTTQTTTVTEPTNMVVSTASITDANCNQADGGASISATGGITGYAYSWSTGSTTTSISNVVAGPYNVTVTDANGCTKTHAVSVNNLNGPTATTASQTSVLCFGNATGAGSVTASGGTTPYTYSWSPNGGSNALASNLLSGTYQVTVTDVNGCKYVQSIAITEPSSSVSVTLSSKTNVDCFGSVGSATVTGNGGVAGFQYSWSNGATTATISNVNANTYTVTVTDNNGCTSTLSTTITQPAAALSSTTSTTANVLCFGNATGAANALASDGTPGYTYTWSNGTTGTSISGVVAGIYTVTIKDANNCSATNTVTVTEPTAGALTSTIGSNIANVKCYGNATGTATVTAGGGTAPYQYSWNNSQTDNVTTGLLAGTYTVIITDANNCSKTETTTITQPAAALGASFSSTQEVFCYGDASGSATSSASGGTPGYQYTWSNGSTEAGISNLVTGTYSVLITDANGCTATASTQITQPAIPLDANFDATPLNGSYPLSVTFTNNSTGADYYVWYFGDGDTSHAANPVHIFDTTGLYTVVMYAHTNKGCIDSAFIKIEVKEPVRIVIPNIFSPNGDGSNEIFTLVGTGVVGLKAEIYDRWGLLIYSWADPKAGWDGTTQSGAKVPDGTYYYIIETKDNEGHDAKWTGYIQLIR